MTTTETPEIPATNLTPVDKLADALALAQKAFDVPTKSKEAKVEKDGRLLYKYKYSDLDDLIKATRPHLVANGLAVVQDVLSKQGAVGIRSTILHKSGQRWSGDVLWMPVGGSKPQDVGIAITYARRYSMGALLNVAAEEDTDAQTDAARQQGSSERKIVKPPDDSKKTTNAKPPVQESEPQVKTIASKEGPFINKQKVKRMFGIAQVHAVSTDALKTYLHNKGIESSDAIPESEYDAIVKDIQAGNVKGGA